MHANKQECWSERQQQVKCLTFQHVHGMCVQVFARPNFSRAWHADVFAGISIPSVALPATVICIRVVSFSHRAGHRGGGEHGTRVSTLARWPVSSCTQQIRGYILRGRASYLHWYGRLGLLSAWPRFPKAPRHGRLGLPLAWPRHRSRGVPPRLRGMASSPIQHGRPQVQRHGLRRQPAWPTRMLPMAWPRHPSQGMARRFRGMASGPIRHGRPEGCRWHGLSTLPRAWPVGSEAWPQAPLGMAD